MKTHTDTPENVSNRTLRLTWCTPFRREFHLPVVVSLTPFRWYNLIDDLDPMWERENRNLLLNFKGPEVWSPECVWSNKSPETGVWLLIGSRKDQDSGSLNLTRRDYRIVPEGRTSTEQYSAESEVLEFLISYSCEK